MPEATIGQTPDVPDISSAITRQEAVFQHQLDWIRAVDSKTPVVIGVATAMLAVAGTVSPGPECITWQSGVLMGAASVPMLFSIAWSAAATFPQTVGPQGSLIFFRGIASMTAIQYDAAVKGRSDRKYLEDLILQTHRNAQIATAKYRAVRHAMGWLFAGTPIWLVACYGLYQG